MSAEPFRRPADADAAAIPRAVRPLAPLYMAGEVRRWHANPALAREGQTNADHQGRCVQLLLMLCPGASPALVRATAFHDVGEVVGDLPGPVKRAHPGLAAAHARIEAEARDRICGALPWLTPVEDRWLSLVDRLEAACFVLSRQPGEAVRPASHWHDTLQRLQVDAEALGCGPAVRAVLDDLLSGDWA
jgi:hypothetical protein